MPTDLVVATRNKKKLAEIRDLLADLDFNILSLEDFQALEKSLSSKAPGADIPEIQEDMNTFEENAKKKALQIAKITGRLTLADDSGLEINYLHGEPGIRSARFAGENASDADRNKKVLDLLKDVPQQERKARFRCAIAIADPNGYIQVATGVCEGEIALEPRGSTGFGYDPIFVVPPYGRTYAELGPEKKNQISHRAIALGKAKKLLKTYLKDLI